MEWAFVALAAVVVGAAIWIVVYTLRLKDDVEHARTGAARAEADRREAQMKLEAQAGVNDAQKKLIKEHEDEIAAYERDLVASGDPAGAAARLRGRLSGKGS